MEDAWLKEPDCPAAISEAENLLESNQYQRALGHLDTNLPSAKSITHHVNTTLFNVCICKLLHRGLELADNALHICEFEQSARAREQGTAVSWTLPV